MFPVKGSYPETLYPILIGLLLVGCSLPPGEPPAAAPPPTRQAVEVVRTPGLRPIENAFQACALASPEIVLFVEETPAALPGPGEIAFRLGEAEDTPTISAAIGLEEIVVLLNEANPLTTLSTARLRDLFSGRLSTWDELSGASHPVQVWTYPQSDDVGRAFSAAALAGEAFSLQARLAPDPAAMLEAVSADPGAVGYLPRAWLENQTGQGGVKAARLEPALAAALRLPVLALSAGEPQGGAYLFLACLQGEIGRRALEDTYEPWQE